MVEPSDPREESPERLRARTFVNVGRGRFDAGRFWEALEAQENALREDPTWVEAHIAKANTLCMLERFDEALAICDKIVRENPAYCRGYTTKANVLHRRGDAAAALSLYRKGFELDPDDRVTAYNFACYWAREGEVEECEKYLTHALAVHPETKPKAAIDPDLASVRERDWFRRLVAFQG